MAETSGGQYRQSNYEKNKAAIAQQKAAVKAARDAQKATQREGGVGKTKEAKPVEVFPQRALSQRTTPGPGTQAPVALPTVAVKTPTVTAPNPFTDRFNLGQPTIQSSLTAPAGHIDLTPPAGGPTEANLAARPFSPDATNRGWMPTQQKYNTELNLMGGQPNIIGGAPVVNGKLIPPHMNQLQQAMDDTAKLQAMHAQLKIAQHREMKWRNNPEGALALQPKISQIEDRLGSAEKIRQDYLAQNMPELKAVYADTARTAAPSVEQLKAQWAQKPEDQPAPQQLVTTPPTPALESNSLADQLKKRQGFDYFSSQPLSYNLPQNQTSYL